jgi:hypothetical protein
MKTKLLLLSASVASMLCSAQSGLTNLSFEAWSTTITGPAPTGWYGSGVTQKTSGAQHLSSYAEIKNVSSSQTGLLMLGSISGTASTFAGGVPYTQTPITFSGFYRSAGLATNDKCDFTAYTTKNGNIAYMAVASKTGNTSSWTSFTAPFMSLGANANDTIYMIFTVATHTSSPATVGASMDLDNITLSSVVGLDEHSVGTAFLAYPNPAAGNITLRSMDERAKFLNVVSVEGRVVAQEHILGETTTLSTASLPEGIYVYEIRSDDKSLLYSSRFVVTK